MELIREFAKATAGKLVLNIPDKFNDRELEILIIPMEEKGQARKKKKINRQTPKMDAFSSSTWFFGDMTLSPTKVWRSGITTS